MSFFAMPTKPVAKKPLPGKPQAVKPAQKNVVQKKPAPAKAKGLRLLKETPQASLVQKKPAPSDPRDDVYLNGALRLETRAAIRASRAFLKMALRHLRAPHSPGLSCAPS